MPTYTYRCPNCRAHKEARHGMLIDCQVFCGDCNGLPRMQRIIVHAPAFKLKGTGWYETDFKSK